MKFPALPAATAIALLLALPAYAQQRPDEGKAGASQGQSGAPSAQQGDSGAMKGDGQDRKQDTQKGAEPKGSMNKGAQAEPRDKASKGSAQTESKDRAQTESKDKAQSKDRAQTDTKDKAQSKDRAQTDTKDKAQSKDRAQTDTKEPGKQGQPGDTGKAAKGATPKTPDRAEGSAPSKNGTASSSQPAGKSGERTRLSEQQRTNVQHTIMQDRKVNRVTTVNFSINVGTRVPRSIRLAPLPVAVFSLVPEYRNYRYFVVHEDICIVDPATYEIVDVITVSSQTAGGPAHATRLVLSDDEREYLLGHVDMGGGSTLALGSFSEGSDVPRSVELRMFPEPVVERIGKLKGYKFFTAENRIAIVDPQGAKVSLVVESRR
jgi:hypothetical protein